MPRASQAFNALVSLLGEALGGPPGAAGMIGPDVAALAQHRHGVALLLHQVAGNGRHGVAPLMMSELERAYRQGAVRRTQALARLEDLGKIFAADNIPWLTLKGPIQAGWLYPDPIRRQSMDLDLLVRSADFARAAAVLEKAGYTARFPPLPQHGFLRRLMLALVRDLTFIAPDDAACAIDLQRRLFVTAPAWTLPLAAKGLPAPRPGPELALYLLAHGAVSYWVRLRWMTDLALLLPRLQPAEWQTLQILARKQGLEASVAASLLLLRALFPFVAMTPAQPWIAAQERRAPVQRRLARYTTMLLCDDPRAPSPLNHVWTAFGANWLLCNRFGTRLRLLLLAPLSSSVKRLAALT